MSNKEVVDPINDPPIDVEELIEIEREKRRIKAANTEFRKELTIREKAYALIRKEKKEKRLAAQKKKRERDDKEYQAALAKARAESLKDANPNAVLLTSSPLKRKQQNL